MNILKINISLKEFYTQKKQSFGEIKPQIWWGEHLFLQADFPAHLL